MRWEQLNEVGDTHNSYSTVDSTIEGIIQKYDKILRDYTRSKHPIYRGMKTIGDFGFGDGSKMNRQSKNTGNYYTLITDNDPAWDYYPSRSKSFICATSTVYASSFGTTMYVVIPLDGQPIGVCPRVDFWDSFDFDPAYINMLISSLIKTFLKRTVDHTNFATMKANLEELSHIIVDHKDEEDVTSLTDEGYPLGMSLWDWYADKLNPEAHGFNVTTNFYTLPSEREVWMSGKVLFIKYTVWDDIKKHYGEE